MCFFVSKTNTVKAITKPTTLTIKYQKSAIMKTTLSMLVFFVVLCHAARYLNPERVKQIHSTDDKIDVICYSNGLWEVCPDPKDKATVENIYGQYKQGAYLSYIKMRISYDEYNDNENWNN